MPSQKRKSKRAGQTNERERLHEAQLSIDRAFDEDDSERRVALAQAALELSSDCTEAYQILAENASSAEEAVSLLTAAVEAARRNIGEADFRKLAGHFYEVPETRPYMQARLDLAECLRGAGHLSEAIDHLQELLKLNPNDNQGCRQRLASALLKTGRREELHDLLAKYPDDFLVDFHYTRALLAFQEQGDTEEARRYLHNAEEKNPHIPAFMTGAKQLPREFPPYVSPGEESEAAYYVGEFLRDWRETPGALPWLRATLKVARPAPVPRRPAPWSRVQQALKQLPQSEAVWEVDLVPLQTGENEKAWMFMIVDASTAEPLHLNVSDERPSDAELWQELISAMRKPNDEEPARPQEILLARKTWHKNWGSKLARIETGCSLVEELVRIPTLIEHIRTNVERSERPDEEILPIEEGALASVPQQIGEIWLMAVQKLPTWIQIGDAMSRPSVLLVFDETNDLILATDLTEEEPTADWLWKGLQNAIARPAAGEPRRPGVVQIISKQDRAEISDQLESLGIRCVVADHSQKIDELIADLAERVGRSRVKSLVNSPGVTTELLAGLFAAADEYYRLAPWRRIPGDTIIRIETDAFSTGVWYGVVMGQMGMELGLALYEDLELVQRLMSEQMTEEESARRTSALSLTFGEVFDISPVDYDAIREHEWPIASEEAFPCVLRVNPGLALRTPLAWEIELLEGCLRALPPFLESESVSATQRVRTSTREMVFALSLVER